MFDSAAFVHALAFGGACFVCREQTLRCNVDLLKIIQLGLTFTDAEGNMAQPCACWQFNFKFSLSYVQLRFCGVFVFFFGL